MYLDRFLKWLEDWIQISYIEKIEENEYSTVKFALGFTVQSAHWFKAGPERNGGSLSPSKHCRIFNPLIVTNSVLQNRETMERNALL